jgi:hypothetical protein
MCHATVLTTLMSYGTVAADRQATIMAALESPKEATLKREEELNAIFDSLRRLGLERMPTF